MSLINVKQSTLQYYKEWNESHHKASIELMLFKKQ